MANLQTTAKSANDWTPQSPWNVMSLTFFSFFGHHVPDLPASEFLTYENPVQMANDNDIELMHHAYLTAPRVLSEKSMVVDFTRDPLKTIMGYAKYICIERRSALTDVCVLNAENKIILVVQQHKWHIDDANEPEPRLSLLFHTITSCGNSSLVDLFMTNKLRYTSLKGLGVHPAGAMMTLVLWIGRQIRLAFKWLSSVMPGRHHDGRDSREEYIDIRIENGCDAVIKMASEQHSHFELAICDTPYGHPLAKKRENGSNCETKTEESPPSALSLHPIRCRIPEIDAHHTRS
ncbi:hypothetical protein PILCRDRAFT_90555 [Piloderma croceum F 1598]|uniref:Uncharacterized protein n=1 Tax=Piloderma croceum (strain F 1598) TaxID=765440 RepID=A0A0C3FFP6_PILCF|nr:hypothetical protein PILCRDRAFT_90555 [Piloderma croceum F 1598]